MSPDNLPKRIDATAQDESNEPSFSKHCDTNEASDQAVRDSTHNLSSSTQSLRTVDDQALIGQLCDEYTYLSGNGWSETDASAWVNAQSARYPQLRDDLTAAIETVRVLISLGGTKATLTSGQILGDFRIGNLIARGGMGSVFEAEQLSLRRPVALKVLTNTDGKLASAELIRFDNEIHAAACLDHPHIVPIYAVERVGPFHFYAMRRIEGANWSQWMRGEFDCDDASLHYRVPQSRSEFERLLRMLRDIADALGHAHQRGVVHRDIKPSNLLLDKQGHVWVVDFGLAQFPTATNLTQTGELVGTLRYMSPEQARSGSRGIDERSDIYSLGATFCELLSGTPLISAMNQSEQLRSILAGEKPACYGKIPYDVETILRKMIALERSDRYQSAADLVDDLNRWLAGQQPHAKRLSTIQQLTRWSRQRTGWLLSVAATLALFVGVLGVLSVSLASTRTQLRKQLVASKIAEARAMMTSRQPGQRFSTLAILDEAKTTGAIVDHSQEDKDLRRIQATALSLRDLREQKNFPRKPGGSLDSAVLNSDHTLWAAYFSGQGLFIHDLSGNQVAKFELPEPPMTVCFSADSQRLCVMREPEYEPVLEVYSLENSTLLWHKAPTEFPSRPRRFAMDTCLIGTELAIGLDGGEIVILDQLTGVIIKKLAGPTTWIGQVKFSPSGKWIAATFPDSFKVLVWNLHTGESVADWTLSQQSFSVAWAPDESYLCFSEGYEICLYACPDWSQWRGKLEGSNEVVANISVHPSGKWLAVYGYDGKTRLWDVSTEKVVLELAGHAQNFSASGKQLGFRSYDGIGIWDVALDDVVWHENSRVVREFGPFFAKFVNDDQWLAIAGDGGVQLWDSRRRELLHTIRSSRVEDLDYDSENKQLFVRAQEGLFRVEVAKLIKLHEQNVVATELVDGRLEADRIVAEVNVEQASLSSAAREIVASTKSGGVYFVDSKQNRKWLHEEGSRLYFVTISPDGRWVTASEKQQPLTYVWYMADDQPQRWEIVSPEGGQVEIATAGDQVYLLTSEQSRYRVWKLEKLHGPTHQYDIARPSGYQKSVAAHHDRLGWLLATDRAKLTSHRVKDGQLARELLDGYQEARTSAIGASDDQKIAIVHSGQGFLVWDLNRLPQAE